MQEIYQAADSHRYDEGTNIFVFVKEYSEGRQ